MKIPTKLLWSFSAFAALASTAMAAPPAVGTVAPDKNYAVLGVNGGANTDATLHSHSGKIVMAYYYTPW